MKQNYKKELKFGVLSGFSTRAIYKMRSKTVRFFQGMSSARKRCYRIITIVLIVLLILNMVFVWMFPDFPERENFAPRTIIRSKERTSTRDTSRRSMELNITVATTVCGQLQLESMATMLKTAILFSLDANLHVIIFTDEETMLKLRAELLKLERRAQQSWAGEYAVNFTYELHYLSFPSPEETGIDWSKEKDKCSNQLLFFPSLLLSTDALIYLNIDAIIFGSLTNVWLEFYKMTPQHLMAASQASEFLHKSMYTKSKGHPYFGPRGLSMGSLLMNLTRMRDNMIETQFVKAYRMYKSILTFPVQDVLNIVFAQMPQQLLTLSCIFNFNWVHCPWKSAGQNHGENVCHRMATDEPVCFCHDVYDRGLYIMHGSSGSLSQEPRAKNNSTFSWMYPIVKKYQFGHSLNNLLMKVHREYKDHKCWMTSKQFLQNALEYFLHFSLF